MTEDRPVPTSAVYYIRVSGALYVKNVYANPAVQEVVLTPLFERALKFTGGPNGELDAKMAYEQTLSVLRGRLGVQLICQITVESIKEQH